MGRISRRGLPLAIALVLLTLLTQSGCWSYREIDNLMIVSGLSVDAGPKDDDLELTVEVIDIDSGQGNVNRTKTISLTGKSMFQLVRNLIAVTGRKLYWSHAKVIVISEEIAKRGVGPYLEYICRDTETRADMYIAMAKGSTAKAVLNAKPVGDRVISFEISDMLRNQKHLGVVPVLEIWDLVDRMERQGRTPLIPVIELIPYGEGHAVKMNGSAILIKGKYEGYLSGQQTFYCRFVKNEIDGGVLLINGKQKPDAISLEILESKTKRQLIVKNNRPTFHIKVETDVSLIEVLDDEPIFAEKDRTRLEQRASQTLKQRISEHIELVQNTYRTDLFGFGTYVHEHNPALWRNYRDRWNTYFPQMEISVEAKVNIRNTAKTLKPIEEKE
ncbi:Ger(x)C family spore germination protein [Gorillibacterium sp. CAU 1737]|uniref:Ger(x)C family spore germination protein n=1 Tax=Gorillibacterium sp. CAU 1737 TaxID=3140362 RepID=UPI0032605084